MLQRAAWALLTFLCGCIPTIKVICRIVFGPSAFSSTAAPLVCLVYDLLPLIFCSLYHLLGWGYALSCIWVALSVRVISFGFVKV